MSTYQGSSEQNQGAGIAIGPLSNKERDPEAGAKRRSRLAAVLHAIPGLAVGAGAAWTVKSCTLAIACTAGAPALTGALAASAAAGLTLGTIAVIKQQRASDETLSGRQVIKTLAFHTGASMIGGGLFYTFSDEIATATQRLSDYVSSLFAGPTSPETPDVTPQPEPHPEPEPQPSPEPTPVPQPEPETPPQPAPEPSHPQPEPRPEPEPAPIPGPDREPDPIPGPGHEPTPLPTPQEPDTTPWPDQAPESQPIQPESNDNLSALDRMEALLGEHNASAAAIAAMERAQNGNAQGIKDLAYFLFNGRGGLPHDTALALELFREAADMGNVQAKVDLAYIEYHGLAGVESNRAGALEEMRQYAAQDRRAASFVRAWDVRPMAMTR